MPIYVDNRGPVARVYYGDGGAGREVDHIHIGDGAHGGPSIYDKRLVPTIRSLTVTPDSFVVSPQPPPMVLVDWDVGDADSIEIKEVVPYFADNADGVVTVLTPDTVVNDGSVSLELASSGTPFGDHYGYLAANTGRTGAARGRIADQATSRVLAVSGHRSSRNSPDNFHISWSGMPTTGRVYGRWVPTTGANVDFALDITDAAPGWTQWAPGISFPVGTRFYEAGARNISFAGVWNAATGLPAGRVFIYEDAARTRLVNLRTVPISDGSSVTRQLPTMAAWRYIRGYQYVLTATNTRGKSVARAQVTRVRLPQIDYFRMRAGSFARGNFNNALRWIVSEWQVSGWPRPDLTLAYAPGNAFAHDLRLTAADPDRRTQYDAQDTGVGDDRITITVGSGPAIYRLTATNSGGSVHADFTYDWPI